MDYRKREANVHMMGFRSYREYLDSPLWAAVRRTVLALRPECYGCGRKAYEVHHQDYRRQTLEGGALHRLTSVCRRCHGEAEVAMGRKVCIAVANRRLEQIRVRNRRLALEAAARRRGER